MPNRNKNKIDIFLQLGVAPLTIFITVIVTLAFGIIGCFESNKDATLYIICDRGFYISLSIIILQTLIQNLFLKEDTDSLKKTIYDLNRKIKSTECVVFPEKKSYINNRIEDALNSYIVRKMKIICYGTSKFGRIIDSIITTHTSVQVEIIVCSPNEIFFDLKSDKQLLKNVIEELAMVKNIKIFASKIPPTIRASVMFTEKEKPIWCSIQPYYIFPDETYKLFKGEGFTPSIVADTENEIMLANLIKVFDKEYNRLKEGNEEITVSKLNEMRQNNVW